MRVEKKEIAKEDGRYLIYYHFPESATEEQTAVFAAVNEAAPNGSAPTESPDTKTAKESGDHV